MNVYSVLRSDDDMPLGATAADNISSAVTTANLAATAADKSLATTAANDNNISAVDKMP